MSVELSTVGILLLIASIGAFLAGVNVQAQRSGHTWWRGYEAGITTGYVKAREDALRAAKVWSNN